MDWRKTNWRVIYPAGFVNAAGARNADMFHPSLAKPLSHDYYRIGVRSEDFGRWVVRVDARMPESGGYQAFKNEKSALDYICDLEIKNPGIFRRCQVWLFPPSTQEKSRSSKKPIKKAKPNKVPTKKRP
jgi:hypothetical protein